MRKIILTLILSIVGLSCIQAQNDKALSVYAPSGLNLRQSADPNSAKLVTVPYGANVKLMEEATTSDMTVDGLSGGMAKVEYQGKTGYMFSGYLVPISIVKEHEDLEKYLARLRSEGQEVYFEEIRRDYDGYFQSEYNYVFAKLSLQEVFLLAKLRFNLPSKLNFPAYKGKGTITVENPDKPKDAWTDEWQVDYDDEGHLAKIFYAKRSEATGMQVTIKYIEQDPGGIMMGVLYIAD